MAAPTNAEHTRARGIAMTAWAIPGCDVGTVADAIAQALADEREWAADRVDTLQGVLNVLGGSNYILGALLDLATEIRDGRD